MIPKTFALFPWSPKMFVIVPDICLLVLPSIHSGENCNWKLIKFDPNKVVPWKQFDNIPCSLNSPVSVRTCSLRPLGGAPWWSWVVWFKRVRIVNLWSVLEETMYEIQYTTWTLILSISYPVLEEGKRKRDDQCMGKLLQGHYTHRSKTQTRSSTSNLKHLYQSNRRFPAVKIWIKLMLFVCSFEKIGPQHSTLCIC